MNWVIGVVWLIWLILCVFYFSGLGHNTPMSLDCVLSTELRMGKCGEASVYNTTTVYYTVRYPTLPAYHDSL